MSFDEPEWLRALTLAERIALLARADDAAPRRKPGEAARKRLARWRESEPFNQESMFARRLAVAGVDEETWLRAFDLSVEEMGALIRDSPEWLSRMAAAYDAFGGTGLAALPLSDELRQRATVGFLEAAAPLLAAAHASLVRRAERLAAERADAPFDPEKAAAALFVGFPEGLLIDISRTMVLELNVARLRGELAGDTPESRFQAFTGRFRDPGAVLAFWREYPVLARHAVETATRWETASAELLEHLCADWPAIRQRFCGGEDPGPLVELEAGGDAHRGGRAVRVLRFASGLRLVYKPHGLAMDVHFQRLLLWLNQRGAEPDLAPLDVLDCGDRGWVAYIESRECQSLAQVARFYQRIGGYLAVFYALDATDFHFENLIAAGERPYPIDLETLFHPRLRQPEIAQPDLRLANRMIARSVLRVGLLPFRVGEAGDFGGADLSGLGAGEGQLTPDEVLQFDGAATDEMRVARKRMPMPGGKNRPKLEGVETDALTWTESIVEGFERMHRLIAREAAALLDDAGPVKAFRRDLARAVLRPTRGYHLLLFESLHPDLLRDALDRDLHLDRLWVGLDEQPFLIPAVGSERADLVRGDMPLFYAGLEADDAVDSQGRRVRGLFEAAPLAAVGERIGGFNEADRKLQAWFIRASLGTLALSRDDLAWPSYEPRAPDASPDDDRLRREALAAAADVGERLAAMALDDGEDIAWIGLAYSQRQWSLTPLLEDLYCGTPGVVMFLAYLGKALDEPRFERMARRGEATLARRLAHTAREIKTLGAFQGWGALIYLYAHLAALWREPRLAARAAEYAERVSDLIDDDPYLDIIGGGAGAVCALLALDRLAPESRALTIARACGDSLVKRARTDERGLYWQTVVAPEAPLTGFAHGAAGVAHALCRLSAASGDPAYRKTALAAMAWERTERDASAARRAAGDAQRAGESQSLSAAWCYGATGVGLSRLWAMDGGETPVLRQEFEDAAAAVRRDGFGRNHSLCHGDLGNLELFLEARKRWGEEPWGADARRYAAIILHSLERDGYLCGTPLSVESPGLMNGLAGVGYGLLRLADPDGAPSVLTLDPPG